MRTSGLVEHFFRHDYGRFVAMPARRVGVQHLELVEDAGQSALIFGIPYWRPHRRAGHVDIAREYRERALRSAPTDAVRELLARRLHV